jgi:hypothetical protein
MPTTPIQTWGMGRLDPFLEAEEADEQAVNLIPSTTFLKGTLLGELTATPGLFKAYASGNADGSQVPKCVLRYDCVTDAAGLITLGGGPTGVSEHAGEKTRSVDAFYSGIFKTTDIVGLDAAAVTAMAARLISGILSNGVIAIPGV